MLEIIDETNCEIFDQLVQEYEEEFSSITGKKKNENGKYSVDTDWKFPNEGFYWKEDSHVVGFCIKTSVGPYSDIGEFYVIPKYRSKGIGHMLAFAVFDRFPGSWQVRQIEGAEKAKRFWRKIIEDYTEGNYTEITQEDPVWGLVTCQRFKSRA